MVLQFRSFTMHPVLVNCTPISRLVNPTSVRSIVLRPPWATFARHSPPDVGTLADWRHCTTLVGTCTMHQNQWSLQSTRNSQWFSSVDAVSRGCCSAHIIFSTLHNPSRCLNSVDTSRCSSRLNKLFRCSSDPVTIFFKTVRSTTMQWMNSRTG